MVSKKKSACYRLFFNSYPIITINKFFYVVNSNNIPIQRHTEVIGCYGISEEAIDNRIANYRTRISATVPMLVKLNKAGAPIGFINSQDAQSIFRDIQEHIGDWIAALSDPFFRVTPPPFEDFIDLDDLASCIFTKSKEVANDTFNLEIKKDNYKLKKWLQPNIKDIEYVERYESKINDLYVWYSKGGFFR
jgi:hypothetical protein